jgi:5-methylcytosine-specific restriction endonuclease McrA
MYKQPMGEISSVYSSEAMLLEAKLSRTAQSKRDEQKAKRKAKRKASRARVLRPQKPKTVYVDDRPVYRPGMGKEFYRTREWLKARYKVLQSRGAVCDCCGMKRKAGIQIHVDHIRPRSKYPGLELATSNLQVLCELCNMGKGAWDETDWRDGGGITHP